MNWYDYENDGLPNLILVLQKQWQQWAIVAHYCHQVLSFRFRYVKRKSFGIGVITAQFKTPRLKLRSIQNEINKSVQIKRGNAKQNKNRSKNWLFFFSLRFECNAIVEMRFEFTSIFKFKLATMGHRRCESMSLIKTKKESNLIRAKKKKWYPLSRKY